MFPWNPCGVFSESSTKTRKLDEIYFWKQGEYIIPNEIEDTLKIKIQKLQMLKKVSL